MGELTLSDDEYKKIGEKLSSIIINKEHMHPGDMQKAAFFFYNIIKNRISFHESDLEKAIEESGQEYSDNIRNYFNQMLPVLNDLREGQRNYSEESYTFTRE
jgi:hypothetical protein